MRRMLDENTLINCPRIYFESELTNVSEIQVELKNGSYLIALHQKNATNVAFLNVVEDEMSISSSTLFNAGEVGTSLAFYQYDDLGQLIEVYDAQENLVTISGHIDIYKF